MKENNEEENKKEENDLLLVRYDSKKIKKYDYRDILLLNDLDLFIKQGGYPMFYSLIYFVQYW